MKKIQADYILGKFMAKIAKNLSDLLAEAKEGKISKDEIDYVAKKIGEIASDDTRSLYTLIHILGRAKAIKYRQLLEGFLYYPTNPMISKIALQSLCTYLDLTKEYLNELKMFIKGVKWDDLDDVRLVAISTAGEFLRSTFDRDLLDSLLQVFEILPSGNDSIKEAENPDLIRSTAYTAIARAMGKDYKQIPGTETISKQLETNSLDLSVIEKANHLVNN